MWEANFDAVPEALTTEEKNAFLAELTGVSLSSDAFFPFRDSIDHASKVRRLMYVERFAYTGIVFLLLFSIFSHLPHRHNTMQSVVAGQAPITLEWKEYLGEKNVCTYLRSTAVVFCFVVGGFFPPGVMEA